MNNKRIDTVSTLIGSCAFTWGLGHLFKLNPLIHLIAILALAALYLSVTLFIQNRRPNNAEEKKIRRNTIYYIFASAFFIYAYIYCVFTQTPLWT